MDFYVYYTHHCNADLAVLETLKSAKFIGVAILNAKLEQSCYNSVPRTKGHECSTD